MRVAAVPALRVHVGPALEAQRKLPSPRLNGDCLSQRLVLEPPRDVDDHLASRQPALAGAADVRVRDLADPHVAADVVVHSAQVGVDAIVVAVGLIRDALRRAEVDPARDGLARVVVEHGHVDPVAAAVHQLDSHPRRLGESLCLHLAPVDTANLRLAILDGKRRRWHRRDLHVGRAALEVLLFAPAFVSVGQEPVRAGLGKRIHVGSVAAVDVHRKVKGLRGVGRVLQYQSRLPGTLPGERVLFELAQCDGGDDEPRTLGDDGERLYSQVRLRVGPRPEVEVAEPALDHLHLTAGHLFPRPFVARREGVVDVCHGPKRLPRHAGDRP